MELIKKQYDGVIEAFAATINHKNEYTKFHSVGVAVSLEFLAKKLGFKITRELRTAAMLHDLGKIYIDDHILEKPCRLNNEERELMNSHPFFSRTILETIPGFEEVADWASMHHECYDGSGYPEGLKGDQIPFEAQMIHAADFLDALATNRPYRAKLPFEKIAFILQQNSSKFNPIIYIAAQSLLDDPEFQKMYDLKGHLYKATESVDEVRLQFVNQRINDLIAAMHSAHEVIQSVQESDGVHLKAGDQSVKLLEEFNGIYEDFSDSLTDLVAKSASLEEKDWPKPKILPDEDRVQSA